MDKSLLNFFLPDGLLDHFEVVTITDTGQLHIHLDERNIPPSVEDSSAKLVSKGFYDAITIQDFPIRDKACYLKIRKRKWLDENSGRIHNNSWELAAKGTRMTKELASFLKAAHR